MKVLIVDDNEDVTYSLKKSLETISSEYEISVANSGKECLEKVKRDTPDIVLLDIMMPEMDGFEVEDKLQIENIPVLFITGKANMLDESKLRKIDYLMKPVDVKELEARMRQILKI